jgi:hypothetical protein
VEDNEVQEQPAEQPATDPAPSLSREQLIGALAEQYNVSPEDIAGAIHLRDQYARANAEVERRDRELKQRERMLEEERERARFQPQFNEYSDPNQRMLYEMIREEREERRRDREERMREDQMRRESAKIQQELTSAYEDYMRTVPTHQRVDEQKFFQGMGKLYPGIPDGMSVRQAVANAAVFMGIQQSYNGFNQPQPQPQNRRAPVVVPSAASYQGGQIQAAGDIGPRDGEPPEQHLERLTRLARENNISLSNLPEGRKFSSG